MPRLVSPLALTLVIIAAACSPATPTAAVLPTFVAPPQEATPSPNEAYPTSQASEPVASQTVSGFSLTLQRAWRDGKQVLADVCFSLPDSSDWTIWNAHFEYGDQTVSEFSSSLLSEQPAPAGSSAQRCDELSFYVPPDADLSAAGLTIESVGAYPTADEYCSLYMPKIQQALQDRGIAITLDCPEVNGTRTMQIVGKPESMSQQDAEQLVYSDEFYTVKGPWSFPVTFSP
jgi:hypothetical protein